MSSIPAAILCIDDEEPALVVRRRLLEKAGYRVLTALTGKEGIELFRYQPFDLVILDYWMADMDGLDVAAELKRLKPKTPIIMLSGYTAILDEGLGKVDLWLRKGEGDPHQLILAVAQLLSRDRDRPTSSS
jgi:CheY-like chemotaxis protein